jgi:hypothetical protein
MSVRPSVVGVQCWVLLGTARFDARGKTTEGPLARALRSLLAIEV